jgi:hypothetical protein
MKDEDCCTYQCEQGRNCPVRRVRAGATPPPDLPIQFADDDLNPLLDDPGPAWWEIITAAIVMVVVIAILVMSAWSVG